MIKWNMLPGELPKTDRVAGFVSKAVLFAVGTEIRAGEYHCNGWFYSKVSDHGDKLSMARGHSDAVVGVSYDTRDLPDAKAWIYLDQIPSPPTVTDSPHE